MLRSNSLCFKTAFAAGLLPFLILAVQACSSDEPTVAQTPNPDAGDVTKPDGSKAGDDDDDDDPSKEDAGTSDADAGARPAPVFLDAAEYADLIVIDAKFPFGVTQKHAADGDILRSHWGRHGGPKVTIDTTVVEWSIAGEATAAAKATDKPLKEATGLPSTFFYGGDGVVDLPFGSLSLLGYVGADSPYPGEALLYDGTYQTVKSRAKANGFYSGAGILDGANGLLVYSALSPLSASDSDTDDCALYATGVCGGALLAPAPCPGSRKLFGWQGFSGSVVADTHGNVFVAASLSSGTTTDEVYGLGHDEITGGGATSARSIAAVDSGGTASLAVVSPENGASGWVLGLGYAPSSPIYAAPYTESSGKVAKDGELLAAAIEQVDGVDGVSLFADAEGDLWLAVIKGDEGTYLELRRKAP